MEAYYDRCQIAGVSGPGTYHLTVKLRNGSLLNPLLRLVPELVFFHHVLDSSVTGILVKRPRSQTGTSHHNPFPSKLDERDCLSLSGLESHSGPRRDIQMQTVGRHSIEDEGWVCLEEGVVRADLLSSVSTEAARQDATDLNGPVPCVLDLDGPTLAPFGELDLPFSADDCSCQWLRRGFRHGEHVVGRDR